MGIKIGVTERGDAGLNLSWKDMLSNYDGVILITKRISDAFVHTVINAIKDYPNIIVHATCTGWGESIVEPNVISYIEQLEGIQSLLWMGFPKDHLVLRVDPIVATLNGRDRARNVLDRALGMGIIDSSSRIRVSVMDEYPHVKKRMFDAFGRFVYDGFQPSPHEMNKVMLLLRSYDNLTFEACAEKKLQGQNIVHCGCVSQKDLDIFNLTSDTSLINGQQRNGCQCLQCKTEMFNHKGQCEHGCLYCYWR